jgi:signal transduction histidine kinase
VRDLDVELLTKSGKVRLGVLSAEGIELRDEPCALLTIEDITGRKELEREIMEIGDRERQRIGQDLHDDLCSHLVGIEVLGEVLNRKLDEECSEQAPCAGRIRSLTSEAIEKTRRLARGLCPVHLVGYGLESALRELCIKVSDLFKISCELRCKESVRIHDNTVATHLFYIAQEAVQNATKHGETRRVTLELLSDEETVTLRVADYGVGIPEQLPATGMGLRIMSHRAQMIGGSFEVKRNPDGGTVVECLVRVPDRKETVHGQV